MAQLILYRELAERLKRSTRTVDRLYAAQMPGLPPIVRLGHQRAVDAALADKFVDSVIRNGGFPAPAAPKKSKRRRP